MEKTLVQWLEAHGYKGRIVSIRRLDDLQETFESSCRQGLLNEEFYQERLTGFVFRPPGDMTEARSLIVVAFRDP